MEVDYSMTTNYEPECSPNYKVFVSVEMHSGTAEAATPSEAKYLAATDCIENVRKYMPTSDLNQVQIAKIDKTTAIRDIFYIVFVPCSEYGLNQPTYKFLLCKDHPKNQVYVCEATIDEVTEIGEGQKKRVAIRFAALRLYEKLRHLYNTNMLPSGAFAYKKHGEYSFDLDLPSFKAHASRNT